HGVGRKFGSWHIFRRRRFSNRNDLLSRFRVRVVSGALSGEGFGQHSGLCLGWLARGDETETIFKPIGVIRPAFAKHSVPEMPSSLKILRVVHGKKGLQRGVCALTTCTAFFPRWSIESRHLRGGSSALPEGVKATPIKGIVMVLRVL